MKKLNPYPGFMKVKARGLIPFFICIFFILSCCIAGKAQPHEFKGWIYSSHEQKLSGKWKFLSDLQVRSSNEFSHIETILVRPGISYEFSVQQSGAAGYAFVGSWDESNGERKFEPEHRVWEQYMAEIENKFTAISMRLRLEQRFLRKEDDNFFAQRLRPYFRFQVFVKNQSTKKEGLYLVLQNEIFLNVHNKENVNNKFFDENRATSAIGYRLNKALDLEAGYLFRYKIEEEKLHNHILQVVLYTNL